MVVRADMNERRDYHRAPATGEDSATVLDEALVSLGRLRNMGAGSAMPVSISTCS